ncbi:predicted protein [Naegleria gruberi]|uniref:Predicted protein n=1 Tax=Naegleria gruberi TaxID=5762 RepID=D2V5M4_NAEGR|nr:uncharacterized protein NAEGRDRAFT_64132 [Naegleria gruberi]EFC47673.1 predicted protein [Naegleria gruberi]|eukprot:XP_002680417.1 predicted protein [Naegleria gruberi strain NEG-M]
MPFLPMNYGSTRKYYQNQLYFEQFFKPKLVNSFTILKKNEVSSNFATRCSLILLGDGFLQKRFLLRICSLFNLSASKGTVRFKVDPYTDNHCIDIITSNPWVIHTARQQQAKIACFCFNLNDYESFVQFFKFSFLSWKKSNELEDEVMEHLERNEKFVLIFGFLSDNEEEKVPHGEICKFIEDNFGKSSISQLHSNRVQYFKINPVSASIENLLFPILYARCLL